MILRIDSLPKVGTVVHVRLDGLSAHNPNGELVPAVEHMPFTRDAMLLSVKELLKSDQPMPTLEGLDRWQADCGGVYTIKVSEAIDVMEKTLNAPDPHPIHLTVIGWLAQEQNEGAAASAVCAFALH